MTKRDLFEITTYTGGLAHTTQDYKAIVPDYQAVDLTLAELARQISAVESNLFLLVAMCNNERLRRNGDVPFETVETFRRLYQTLGHTVVQLEDAQWVARYEHERTKDESDYLIED